MFAPMRQLLANEMKVLHEVATNFKVQCYNGLPVSAKDCDKSAVELYKLVDSGNSLYNKTAHEEAKAAEEEAAEFMQRNLTNAEAKAVSTPESGEAWCGSFFDVFFDAVVAAQSEEGGEEKAELVQKAKTQQKAAPQKAAIKKALLKK